MVQKTKGLLFEDDQVEIFFGNRHFLLSELTQLKPTGVHAVKQTHSDIFHVINREEPIHPQPEGDAIGTEMRKQHLVIKTADCLPVMIYSSELKRVAAVHAGWKGVANRIVVKTIQQYFSKAKQIKIWIGPHITMKSFQIKDDVVQKLKASVSASIVSKMEFEKLNEHHFVDLVEIVKLQMASEFPETKFEVFNSGVDTKTVEDFHSYRREPTVGGRNISYIKLK